MRFITTMLCLAAGLATTLANTIPAHTLDKRDETYSCDGSFRCDTKRSIEPIRDAAINNLKRGVDAEGKPNYVYQASR